MDAGNQKTRAPRNRTISLSEGEVERYRRNLLRLSGSVNRRQIENRTIHQDLFEALGWLPSSFVDLLFIDPPPYNLTKSFNAATFRHRSVEEYERWLESWFPKLLKTVKPGASIYICGEWRSSAAIQRVAEKYLVVRYRITWEREKGRGRTNQLEKLPGGHLVLHDVKKLHF